MRYICKFIFDSTVRTVETNDIVKLQNGFLIDDEVRFTEKTELAEYWIPPSQIIHIKIEEG